jgi:hypothetical protein
LVRFGAAYSFHHSSLAEVGQRLLAGVELAELARALHTPDPGVEDFRVALAAKDLGAVAALLVTPAHAPHDSGVALDLFDAHPVALPPESIRAPKLPLTGVGETGTGRRRRGGSTSPAASQASRSSGRMRKRLHIRFAFSSPRRIAS